MSNTLLEFGELQSYTYSMSKSYQLLLKFDSTNSVVIQRIKELKQNDLKLNLENGRIKTFLIPLAR